MGVTVLSGPHELAGEFVPQLFSVPYSSLPEVARASDMSGQLERSNWIEPPFRTSLSLGQEVQLQPQTLLLGIGALALGMFLFGMQAQPKIRKARRTSIEKKIDKLKGQLRTLEAKA